MKQGNDMKKTSFLVAATTACAIGVLVVGANDPWSSRSVGTANLSATGEAETFAGTRGESFSDASTISTPAIFFRSISHNDCWCPNRHPQSINT